MAGLGAVWLDGGPREKERLLPGALSGAASSVALLSDSVQYLHDFVHAYEAWVLGVSAALVVGGGWLEFNQRRGGGHKHGFPWLFALSVGCFVLNVFLRTHGVDSRTADSR